MEQIVARFVARLRRAGLRVSPGECLDAVRALGAGGLEERARAKALLQLTLVKTRKDLLLFGSLFEAFFESDAVEAARRAQEEDAEATVVALDGKARPAGSPEEGERSGARIAVEDEAEDGGDLDLDTLEPMDGGSEGGPRLAVQTRRYRGEKAREARPINYTRGPIYAGATEDLLARWSNDGVKPFSPAEEAAMEEVVARTVRRLKKDAREMRSRQPRGRLNLVKTLQRNYRHGMVPFVRVLRRQRKERPRLVVLCDVSYSVSHASRFMLLLLHTLQKGLLDVRSFVFNRDIAEVTGLLRRLPLNSTLELVDSGAIVNLQDDSDFGAAFATFEQEHLASLRGRPAVIVLGDARNNYNEARAEVLGAIRERASTMLWLTPEERESWDLGDCLMSVYAPRCDRVEVVRNVEELGRVVEELVRGWYDGGGRPALADEAERLPPALGARRPAWKHGGEPVRP